MTDARARNLRIFYILILTQTFSMIGTRISSLAVGIQVFNDTGSATPLALVAFFATVPMVLASTFSGVLADRWDRRYVMILSDFGQAIATSALLLSFATGRFELWHLYMVAAVQSIFGVFQGPAFMASVTLLVPDDKRDGANAIQQMTGPMAGIIAPIFAGVIYAAGGVEGAILFDLATFLTAMAVVFSVRLPRPEISAEGRAMKGSVLREALGGLQYLRARRPLILLALYASFLNFMFAGAMTVSMPYILARTGSETLTGVIISLESVGAIIGGVLIGVWGGTRPRMNTVIPAIGVSGLMLALAGMSQSALPLAASIFLMMLPLPMANTLLMSILQVKVPPDIQGRVFAVLSTFSLMLTPLAQLGIGPLVDQVAEPAVGGPGWEAVAPLVGDQFGAGIGLIMLVAGAFAAGSAVLAFATPSLRRAEALIPDYVPAPAEDAAVASEPVINPAPLPGDLAAATPTA